MISARASVDLCGAEFRAAGFLADLRDLKFCILISEQSITICEYPEVQPIFVGKSMAWIDPTLKS
jgi:hypothetical protein